LRTDLRFTAFAAALALVGGLAFTLSAYAMSPLVLPALLLGAAVVALALARPAFGLAAVFLATVGESTSLPLPTGSLTPSESLLVVLGLGYLARLLFYPGSVVRPSARDLPFAGLLVAGVLGLTFAQDPAPVFRVVTLWLLFYCVFLQVQSFTAAEMRMALTALAVGAGVLGGIGTVRYLQSGHAVLFNGGQITGARATGTFDQANYYASLLQLALLPGLALLLTRARNWVLVVPLAAGIAGLAFSLSRGAALGFAVGLVVLLSWNRARWLGISLAIVMAVATMANANPLVGSQQVTTVEQRLSTLTETTTATETNSRPRIWAAAIDETEQHPALGIGLNQFRQVAEQRDLTERGLPLENAHNIFLSLGVETGLIGLACFIAFLGAVSRRALRAIRVADPAARGLAIGLMASLVGFLIQGLTANQLRDNLLAGTFLALAGMLTALGRRDDPAGEPA
jgi:O-antigen ligase